MAVCVQIGWSTLASDRGTVCFSEKTSVSDRTGEAKVLEPCTSGEHLGPLAQQTQQSLRKALVSVGPCRQSRWRNAMFEKLDGVDGWDGDEKGNKALSTLVTSGSFWLHIRSQRKCSCCGEQEEVEWQLGGHLCHPHAENRPRWPGTSARSYICCSVLHSNTYEAFRRETFPLFHTECFRYFQGIAPAKSLSFTFWLLLC